MDVVTAQLVFKKAGTYHKSIDGRIGQGTLDAIDMGLSGFNVTDLHPSASRLVAGVQGTLRRAGLNVTIDGWFGPETEAGIESYLKTPAWRDDDQDAADSTGDYPRYAGIRDFYGAPGEHWTTIVPPFPMVLAWDTNTRVNKITIHERIKDPYEGMLSEIKDNLGGDKIMDLGLHLFGGTANIRKMRGGSKFSTHSWAIAHDFDPLRNGLRSKKSTARLGKADAEPFWQIVEKYGATSLGREKNYDWMHIQWVEV